MFRIGLFEEPLGDGYVVFQLMYFFLPTIPFAIRKVHFDTIINSIS